MVTALASHTYLQRFVGAVMLDPAIYEDVEADETATIQACATVFLSSVAAGVGVRELGAQTLPTVGFVSALALLTWVAWALITLGIGVRLIPEPQTRSTAGELLRTLGFATAPGCLRVLGVVPFAAVPVFVVTALWMLAAMLVAVRQALDYKTTARAVAVCILGWMLTMLIAIALGVMFGPTLA